MRKVTKHVKEDVVVREALLKDGSLVVEGCPWINLLCFLCEDPEGKRPVDKGLNDTPPLMDAEVGKRKSYEIGADVTVARPSMGAHLDDDGNDKLFADGLQADVSPRDEIGE